MMMLTKAETPIEPTSPAAQLNAMIARFDPAIQRVVRQARTKLRKRLPAAVELVYDNYNARSDTAPRRRKAT